MDRGEIGLRNEPWKRFVMCMGKTKLDLSAFIEPGGRCFFFLLKIS